MTILERQKLCLVAALVLLANAVDLASTYVTSPDLKGEWNVLHRLFGLGWSGIIGAKIIGGWLAVAGYAYYLRHRTACYPAPGADRDAFCRHFSFGKPVSWIEALSGIPFGRHLGVNVGYFWAGMQLLIFWVALDNILLREGIVCPIRQYSEMGYHLTQSWAIAAIILTRFYLSNYRRYCLLSQPVAVRRG